MNTKYLIAAFGILLLAGCSAKPVVASREYQPNKRIAINIASKNITSKEESELRNIVAEFCGSSNYNLVKQEDIYKGTKISYGTVYDQNAKPEDKSKTFLATDIDGERKYDYTSYTYVCK